MCPVQGMVRDLCTGTSDDGRRQRREAASVQPVTCDHCCVSVSTSLQKDVSEAIRDKDRLGRFYTLYHADTFKLHLVKLNPCVHVISR